MHSVHNIHSSWISNVRNIDLNILRLSRRFSHWPAKPYYTFIQRFAHSQSVTHQVRRMCHFVWRRNSCSASAKEEKKKTFIVGHEIATKIVNNQKIQLEIKLIHKWKTQINIYRWNAMLQTIIDNCLRLEITQIIVVQNV